MLVLFHSFLHHSSDTLAPPVPTTTAAGAVQMLQCEFLVPNHLMVRVRVTVVLQAIFPTVAVAVAVAVSLAAAVVLKGLVLGSVV